jgi:hypothetical protein
VTSFTVATAANNADSKRLQGVRHRFSCSRQGQTSRAIVAAPQHLLQSIDYIEYRQYFDTSMAAPMLHHNNKEDLSIPTPPLSPAPSGALLARTKTK